MITDLIKRATLPKLRPAAEDAKDPAVNPFQRLSPAAERLVEQDPAAAQEIVEATQETQRLIVKRQVLKGVTEGFHRVFEIGLVTGAVVAAVVQVLIQLVKL